jgi:hypothetical protein
MRTLNWARRPLAVSAALALLTILPSCGGGGGGSNNPTPVTQPPAPVPVRTQIGGGNFTVGAFDVALGTLTVTSTGTLEVVVDWTFASSDIDIRLYSGACTAAQARTNACSVLAQTTSLTQKPETLTVVNLAAGNYTFGFLNFSNRSESGAFQAFIIR